MTLSPATAAALTIDRVACAITTHSGTVTTHEVGDFCSRWIKETDQIEIEEERLEFLIAFGVSPEEALRQVIVEAAVNAWRERNGGPAILAAPVPRYANRPS